MSNQDNTGKSGVFCVIKEGKRTYQVMENGEEIRSLSVNDRGYVFLKNRGATVAELVVNRDKGVQNIGGYEQCKMVHKPIDVDSIEGLMDVYKKIHDQNFYSRGEKIVTGEEKEKLGKLMTSFLDTYVFNNTESRSVLNEYLNKPTEDDLNKIKQSNAAYLKTLNDRVKEM